MAFRSSRVGRVYLFSWDGLPQVGDFDVSLAEMAKGVQEAGDKLHQIILVDPSMEIPSAEIRRRSLSATRQALEHCATMDAVIEGDTVKHNLLRASVRGILTLLSAYRGRVFLHATLRESLDRIAREAPVDRERVRAEAERLGFRS